MTNAPSNSTVISDLPIASSINDGDTALVLRSDKSLVNMPLKLLANVPKTPLILICDDDIPPDGYFSLDGGAFDLDKYPILAKKYPSGKLPNWTNRVPRMAGDLIALGEMQEDALQNIKGTISTLFQGGASVFHSATGCFSLPTQESGWIFQSNLRGGGTYDPLSFDASKNARTAAETRVKSVGVNFIIQAI